MCPDWPYEKKHFLSCILEFECTNNIAEYEALVQGLRKAIELKENNIKVFGDSEIIVKQILNQIHCISPHLKAYQNEVLDNVRGQEVYSFTDGFFRLPSDQNCSRGVRIINL